MIYVDPELEFNEGWLKLVDYVEEKILPLIYEKNQHLYSQGLGTGFEAGFRAGVKAAQEKESEDE